MKKIIKLGLSTILATSMYGCIPTRVDYHEANNYSGNISDFTNNYVKRETALDAAEVSREVRCLDDYTGKYLKGAEGLNKLETCVNDLREQDKWVYGISSAFFDGTKVFYITKGVKNNSSSTAPASTSRSGSVGGNGGSIFY